MKNVLQKQTGMTILEVLIGSFIIGLFAWSLSTFMNAQNKTKLSIERRNKLRTLLEQVLTEVHTKSSNDLPAPGNCLVRYYLLDGRHLPPDTTSTNNSSICATAVPEASKKGQFKIVVLVRAATGIDAEFLDAPAHMKLPSIVTGIREIELVGGARLIEGTPITREYRITMYKRQ